MKLGIQKEGYADHVWTTLDGYEITQSQVEEIKSIVQEATGKNLPFEDALRMVDLFKRFTTDDFKV